MFVVDGYAVLFFSQVYLPQGCKVHQAYLVTEVKRVILVSLEFLCLGHLGEMVYEGLLAHQVLRAHQVMVIGSQDFISAQRC